LCDIAQALRAKHPEYDALLARLLDFQQHGRLFQE
jgi:hypothetical protein